MIEDTDVDYGKMIRDYKVAMNRAAFADPYEKLAAANWDYLEVEIPDDPELRDYVHAEVMRTLDELLRAAGIEAR